MGKKPTFDPLADEGVFTVGRIFTRDFGWAFRPQPVADFGIDAHVEVCDKGEPLGKLLFLQIKSGPSYLREKTSAGYIYRGDEKHYEYWVNLPIPVLLTIYDPATEKVYWQLISCVTTSRTQRGFRALVPIQQVLDVAAKEKILTVINGGTAERSEVSSEPLDVTTCDIEAHRSALGIGEVVRGRQLEEIRDVYLGNAKTQVRRLTEQMWQGEIALSAWELAFGATIKNAFICSYVLAMGGFDNVALPQFSRISGMLRQQFRSLAEFASDLSVGRYRKAELNKIIERSELYIDCSVLAFEMGQAIRGEVEYTRTGDNWHVRVLGRE